MKNREIADLLSKIADALDLKGNSFFKIRAYRRASRAIKDLAEDIEKLYRNGELTEISGVGEGIAKKIGEYLETGKMSKYQEVTSDIPGGLLELLSIRDLGPKTLKTLHEELGVKNIEDLKGVIESGQFSKLEGLGEKTASKIMENIERYEKKHGEQRRFTLGEIMPTLNDITEKIKKLKHVKRVSTAGSARRMKETVGDLDILVESKRPDRVNEEFKKLPQIEKVLESGATKTSALLEGTGIRMDLRILSPDSYGAALVYFTGSKDHNVKIRGIAQKKNLKVNEYGVFQGDEKIAGETEEEVYKSLGMSFIPPEIREDRGEVEKALEDDLPSLIGYDDIMGNLHTHSKFSDGENTLKELAEYAKEYGYSYIGITEHSKTASYAGGIDEEGVKKQIDEIDSLNENYSDFTILKGIECDILPDGSLDFSDSILEKLDFVIGAIHSGFKKNVTERMISSMENPNLSILAHPTGRLISKREGYDVDIDGIIEEAVDKNVILEINAYYDRLDLNEFNAKNAYKKGARLCINTDAHNLRMFDWMKLGIGIARRAWLPPECIINTKNLNKLREYFIRNG